LVSVEASVLAASEVTGRKATLPGAKAAADPRVRKRTALESFMVSIWIYW
jgi:hypothetical protein